MKFVVMIAYYFPPEGNAGVYRPLRFVRHLPSREWCASVVSLDTDHYERYDPGLLALVPSGTEVTRVKACDLWQEFQRRRGRHIEQRLSTASAVAGTRPRLAKRMPIYSFVREIVRTAEAWYYHPDKAMSWIQPAVEATIELCARRRPNVIWATAGPISSFIVAQRVSQRIKVPYVLDFRDPWTITRTEFEARRPGWAQRRDRRMLSELFKGAQAVIFRYDTEAECFWLAYPGVLDAVRIHVIPNGYEGRIDDLRVDNGEKCKILYTGTLSSYRYDTLLHALHSFKWSDPARAKQLHLLFIGEGTEALTEQVAALGLSDMVATAGPTSYAEITSLQQEAHALLVLGRLPTIRGYELLAGAKLYSYLKTGRPIIGVLPLDETKKTLQRIGVSTVADVDSPSQTIAVFRHLLNAWSSGTLSSLAPDRAACEAYSSERQTAALVRALEGVPAVEPFVPGSVDIPPSLRGEIRRGKWAGDSSDYRRT
jgi:hypothetical protein